MSKNCKNDFFWLVHRHYLCKDMDLGFLLFPYNDSNNFVFIILQLLIIYNYVCNETWSNELIFLFCTFLPIFWLCWEYRGGSQNGQKWGWPPGPHILPETLLKSIDPEWGIESCEQNSTNWVISGWKLTQVDYSADIFILAQILKNNSAGILGVKRKGKDFPGCDQNNSGPRAAVVFGAEPQQGKGVAPLIIESG